MESAPKYNGSLGSRHMHATAGGATVVAAAVTAEVSNIGPS